MAFQPPSRTVGETLLREAVIGLFACLLAAILISLIFDDPFWLTLQYSLCIGFSIQALIESGRFGGAALRSRLAGDRCWWERRWPGWPLMAPWVVASTVAGYLLGSLLAGWLTGRPIEFGVAPSGRALVIALAVSLMIAGGITYYFASRAQLADSRAAAERAQRAATENRLALLQAQLEPHMLFNTLANLRVLVGLDPARAQTMLDHLIGFLRATLTASRQPSHPLADEFARLADYLALMQVRMGSRLSVVLDLPAALAALPVPPLLLQPLVENAIRHGLEPKVEGGRIEVGARADGPLLRLTVRDTGVGLPESTAGAAPVQRVSDATPAGSFGLSQVRSRLQALHGDRARLQLARAGDAEGGTVAEVQLPLPGATA